MSNVPASGGKRLRRSGAQLPERVLAVLAAGEGTCPGQREVAERLCMSPRTLKRQLQRQGLRFRDLRERVLRQRAEQLLGGTRLPVDQVALQVGYSSGANFSRAFNRWQGQAPGQFRQRLGAVGESPTPVGTAP